MIINKHSMQFNQQSTKLSIFKNTYQSNFQSFTNYLQFFCFLTLSFRFYLKTHQPNMQPNQVTKDEKQVFLRNQILEGGLDPQSFMDFMGTIKNQAENIDLNNWTIQQLEKLVQDFKLQIKADKQTFEEVNKSRVRESQQMMSKILKSSLFKKQRVNYDKGLYDYELSNEQQCKKAQKQFNFNPKIKPVAHITNWQVRTHGGLFFGIGATKQLWLKIETNFTQKAIERTNSDFQWYRNALLKFHPGSYVPPLAQLRAIEPEDKKGLGQRAKLIEFFLNSIIQYEYLIQSQISKFFLTEPDHTKLTNYKTKERSIVQTKNVGRIENLEGKFHLQLSNRTQKFIKHSALFGKVSQEIYTQINTQINKILSDMQTLSKHVLYVSNSCGTLHQKYTKICGLNEIKQNGMENIMVLLYNMLSNVGKNIKEHITVIKEFSDEYVHSSIRSWEEFWLHDKRYHKEFDSYLNFKSQLVRKKERYFNDVSKWELQNPHDYDRISRMNISAMEKQEVFAMMFPKENKIEQELRIWIAYLNKAYEESFRALMTAEQTHIRQRLKIYIEKTSGLNTETYFSQELKQLISVAV